ncbi:hypothetical protein, partial [Caldithrix abyssi]
MIVARRFNGGLFVRPGLQSETVSTVYANEQRHTILCKWPRSLHSQSLLLVPEILNTNGKN